MIASATHLLGRAGVSEASFSNVLAASGAPRGSIYHHFPGGKDELVAASVRTVGAQLLLALREGPAAEPRDVALTFAGLFRRLLIGSGATSGCAVAAVSTTAPAEQPDQNAAAEVFRAWRRELATLYARCGLPTAPADASAVLTIAVVEGALVLARAERDVAVFDLAVERLLAALAQAPHDRAHVGSNTAGASRAPGPHALEGLS